MQRKQTIAFSIVATSFAPQGFTNAALPPSISFVGPRSVGLSVAKACWTLTTPPLTCAPIANPPADWNGTNQPFCLCSHNGFLWGAMGDRVYRSSQVDHEDFLSFPYQKAIFPGVGEYIVAMYSYTGFLRL